MISLVAVLAWRSPVVWPWLGMFSVLAMTLCGHFIHGATSISATIWSADSCIGGLGCVGGTFPTAPVGHGRPDTSMFRSSRAYLNVDIHRLQTVIADQDSTRAIDLAISKSQEGDTVWMVAPANGWMMTRRLWLRLFGGFHPGFRWRWPIRWILNIAIIATVSPVIGKVVWFTPVQIFTRLPLIQWLCLHYVRAARFGWCCTSTDMRRDWLNTRVCLRPYR